MISVASRTLSAKPRPAHEQRPAQAAQREAERRRSRTPPSRSSGLAPRILPGSSSSLKPGRLPHEQDEQHDRQDERDDRPRLAQPLRERELVRADLGSSVGRRARRRAARSAPASALGLGGVHRRSSRGTVRTRPLPRARWTSFAAGADSRTRRDARPGHELERARRARPAGRPASTGRRSGSSYATPTSRVVCASETATPGTPRRAASSAARALPSPT